MHFNYFQCTVRTLIHACGIMQIPLYRIYVIYPKALRGLKYTLVKLGVIIKWGNKSKPPYYTIRNLLLNLLVSMAMFYIYEGENVLIFHKLVFAGQWKIRCTLELLNQINLVSYLLIDLKSISIQCYRMSAKDLFNSMSIYWGEDTLIQWTWYRKRY